MIEDDVVWEVRVDCIDGGHAVVEAVALDAMTGQRSLRVMPERVDLSWNIAIDSPWRKYVVEPSFIRKIFFGDSYVKRLRNAMREVSLWCQTQSPLYRVPQISGSDQSAKVLGVPP